MLIFGVLACVGAGGPPSTDSPSDSAGETSVEPISGLTATVDDVVGTVATIRWTTAEPGDTWVDVAEDGAWTRSVAGNTSADGTEHTVILAGLAGGLAWTWRARSETDAGTVTSADQVFETAAPPEAFELEAEVFDVPSDGWIVAAVEGKADGVVIFDGQGRPVWWHVCAEDEEVDRARLSPDGLDVLYHQVTDSDGATSEIVRQPLAGGAATSIPAPNAHHDFQAYDDGSYLYLRHDEREMDDLIVRGDQLVERDADGVETVRWSIWDERSPLRIPEIPQGDFFDWSHCNAVVDDPEHDAWLVSCAEISAVFSIDRPTGALRWQMGGVESDFTVDVPFGGQHSPFVVPGGVLLYDNGLDPEGTSEAAEYAIDEASFTATRTWSWDVGGWSLMRGSAGRLTNGDTLVCTGSLETIEVVSPEGVVRWSVEISGGSQFTFADAVTAIGGG